MVASLTKEDVAGRSLLWQSILTKVLSLSWGAPEGRAFSFRWKNALVVKMELENIGFLLNSCPGFPKLAFGLEPYKATGKKHRYSTNADRISMWLLVIYQEWSQVAFSLQCSILVLFINKCFKDSFKNQNFCSFGNTLVTGV